MGTPSLPGNTYGILSQLLNGLATNTPSQTACVTKSGECASPMVGGFAHDIERQIVAHCVAAAVPVVELQSICVKALHAS